MYALQKNVKGFKLTRKEEIEIIVGLHIMQGDSRFPRVRLYWDTAVQLEVFSKNMIKNRFFQLRTNLHVVDQKPNGCTDKMFKVRPLYESIRKRCKELQMERDLC